jgi:hypothetical protein
MSTKSHRTVLCSFCGVGAEGEIQKFKLAVAHHSIMESVEARSIVAALNAEPFSKEFTLITFDAQEPLQLLQVETHTCPSTTTCSLFALRNGAHNLFGCRPTFGPLWLRQQMGPMSCSSASSLSLA